MARILVIDVNVLTRHMLRQALEWAGYEVLEAPDGQVGVYMHCTSPADVVITDMLLPEQQGLETIRVLQRICPGVKIIAISGIGQIGDFNFLTIAQHLGAQRVFQKPFVLREMLNAIHDVLHMSD